MMATYDDRLERALRSLPGTAEGITELLIRHGIRGQVADAERCPLAIWLSQQTEADIWVGVYKARHVPGEGLPLPRAAVEFTQKFDLDPEMPRREELIGLTQLNNV